MATVEKIPSNLEKDEKGCISCPSNPTEVEHGTALLSPSEERKLVRKIDLQ